MVNEMQELIHVVREFSEKRNWTRFHHPKELEIALALGAAEVLEHFRFTTEFDTDKVANELADVLNVVLRLSDVLGIDLIQWFYHKMAENEAKYPVEKCYGKNLKYSQVK